MKNKKKRKKNFKKKKILIIVLGVIVIILLSFIMYKVFLLNKYNINKLNLNNYDTFIKAYNDKTTITTDNIELNENEYLNYQNIKVKNIFGPNVEEDYFNNIGQQVIYKKKDSEGNVSDSMSITIRDTYLKMFKATKKEHFITSMDSKDNYPIEADISDYLNKNKINNDLELLNFLSEIRNKKINIFTSTKDIKDYYGTHLIASIVIPKIDMFKIIEGKNTGYIYSINNINEIVIEKDKQSYIFLLNNKTDEEILEFINTIIIE